MASILVLSKRMEMGGTEKALIALLKFLIQDGHTVELMLLNKKGPTLNAIPSEVRVTEVAFSNSDIIEKMAGKQINDVPFSIVKRTVGKLSKFLYRQNGKKNNMYPFLLKRVNSVEKEYDVLFDFHGYGYFFTAYGAERIKAKRKAVWFHDENIYWADWAKDYYVYYDKLYCVSESVKHAVDFKFSNLKNRTEVLYNFIDIEDIINKSEIKANDEMKSDKFKILTIGRLAEQKGLDYAIRIARILKEKGIAFNWYVIGDGILKNSLQRLVVECDVSDCFHLIGKRENPYPYLRECDIYVQPSRHEGYGITVLEARVLRKPMVVSDLSPFREQIIDGKTGYLVPLHEQAFADKIIALYYDENDRRRLSQNLLNDSISFMDSKRKLKRFIEGNI